MIGSGCPVKAKQKLSLNHVLAVRGLNGKALAKRLDATESTVSRLRNGLEPSEDMKRRIIGALDLNEHEIRGLGWEESESG